jgi:hypothetical protein
MKITDSIKPHLPKDVRNASDYRPDPRATDTCKLRSVKASHYHNVFDPWASCDTGAST